MLTEAARATLIEAVRLVAEFGREAIQAIEDAEERGDLQEWEVDEFACQAEDL